MNRAPCYQERMKLVHDYRRRTREERRLRRERRLWAMIAGEIVVLTALLWLNVDVL